MSKAQAMGVMGAMPATLPVVTVLLLAVAGAGASEPDRGLLLDRRPWLAEDKGVEERLAALLPTLSVEQLAAQTLHLWTTISMATIVSTYNKTGVGASYIAHPTGNATCDSDPACNLASRLAANRELLRSAGIPLTFVSETLHSPWISQGVVMPMPVTMGATWNVSLLKDVGRAIATEATACGVTRAFSPEINVW
jgi:beta-glucosidase-like glycosyl hydrolase